jgi:hypothetical protein
LERLRVGRRVEVQITVRDALADGLRDAERGVLVADPLRFPAATMVDEDPPRAFPEPDFHSHGINTLSQGTENVLDECIEPCRFGRNPELAGPAIELRYLHNDATAEAVVWQRL